MMRACEERAFGLSTCLNLPLSTLRGCYRDSLHQTEGTTEKQHPAIPACDDPSTKNCLHCGERQVISEHWHSSTRFIFSPALSQAPSQFPLQPTKGGGCSLLAPRLACSLSLQPVSSVIQLQPRNGSQVQEPRGRRASRLWPVQ